MALQLPPLESSDIPVDDGGGSCVVFYRTKLVKFFGRFTPIVLQNTNGPCPLLAICNVLSLRNELDLEIWPTSVSQEKLLLLLKEQILKAKNTSQNISTSEFIKKMVEAIDQVDRLSLGVYVDTRFRKIDDFEYTSEHAIFDVLGINLYHGWIVDPEDIDTAQAIGSLSYNSVTEGLAAFQAAKDLSNTNTAAISASGASSPSILKNDSFGESEDTNSFHQSGRGDREEKEELMRALTLSKIETTTPLHEPISACYDLYDSSLSSDNCVAEIDSASPESRIDEESNFPIVSGSMENAALDIGHINDSVDSQSSQKTCPADVSTFQLCQMPKNDMHERCVANHPVQVTSSADQELHNEVTEKTEAKGGLSSPACSQNIAVENKWLLVQNFLNTSSIQMTYYGLKCLHEGVKDEEICILFRNNHLSTMFKYREELYLLITDQGYIDSDMAWEKLSEINGDADFVTADFMPLWAQNVNDDASPHSDSDIPKLLRDLPDFDDFIGGPE